MSKPFVYESSLHKGKVHVSVGPEDCRIHLVFTREEALDFAADLTSEAERLDRARVGTPADLGCEVL